MYITPRTIFIAKCASVIVTMAALIIGLTFGLRTPAPANKEPPFPKLPTTDVTTQPAAMTTEAQRPRSNARRYGSAAVTSDSPTCSQVGVQVLRENGSAVDAGVATMLCKGALNNYLMGIGGGHFATIYERPRTGGAREVKTVLSRETAPLAAHRDMFVNNTDSSASTIGGLAIATPGDIAGYHAEWLRFGRLPWPRLLQPSIDLLTHGYKIESHLASALWAFVGHPRRDVCQWPVLRQVYCNDTDLPGREGDLVRDPLLARTYQRVAADPASFYSGALADDIAADIHDAHGLVNKTDLESYRSRMSDPLTMKLTNGNYSLHALRPPSSGVILNYILSILDGYHFSPSAPPGTVTLTAHRIVEAFKFAYAKRSALGDELFVNVTDLIGNLTSRDYADAIRRRINDTHTQRVEYYEPAFAVKNDGGTSGCAVYAPDGSAAAYTGTHLYDSHRVNVSKRSFGSYVKGSRTGILFNNEMDDFSTPGTSNSFGVPASPSNYIAPGKMPMSSMCPTVVTDSQGTVVLATGGSGGTRITTGVAWVTMQNLWFGRDLGFSTDEPRLHHQLVPHRVQAERRFNPAVLQGLREKQHNVTWRGNVGVVTSVAYECAACERAGSCAPGRLCVHAAADSTRRSGGGPAGY